MEIQLDHMRYRRTTIDDIESLTSFRVRFLNELYGHPENDDTEILRKSRREYFHQAIPSSAFIAWLAEYDGQIIGTGGIVIWQMLARYYRGLESGRLGYVLNLYTIPEARRKGICTRLLNELMTEAKTLGIRYLHLHASEDGMSIYRKAGFVEADQIELVLRLK